MRGALCVYSGTSRTWTREAVDLVAAFAAEAAMALKKASLYEEAQRGLATKSVLLSELHHRVKNNLQTVALLLSPGLRLPIAPGAIGKQRDCGRAHGRRAAWSCTALRPATRRSMIVAGNLWQRSA